MDTIYQLVGNRDWSTLKKILFYPMAIFFRKSFHFFFLIRKTSEVVKEII